MRFVSILGGSFLAAALAGCGTVPLHQHNVKALQKIGKGTSVTDVDKAFGSSTVLAARTVQVAGRTYLLRLYDLAVPSGYSSFDSRIPFAVVFTGNDGKVLIWGRLEDLSKSTNPEIISLLPQLERAYSRYQFFRNNPGERPPQTGPFDCEHVCR